MIKLFKLTLIAFVLSVFSAQNTEAKVFQKITIVGNERISQDVIRGYIPSITKNSDISSQEINNAIKSLYRLDFFSEVEIYPSGSELIISVEENPLITDIVFEGNDSIDTEMLEMEIALKKRSVLTKSKVRDDVKRITNLYRKLGKFNASVNPQIIKSKYNRAKLVFEINEGKKAKVKAIEFVGNKVFSDDVLKDEISTKEAKVLRFGASELYSPERVDFDMEMLRRFYFSKGYADFNVISSVAQITPAQDKFFITVLVEEGRKYKFGKISITNKIEKFDASILETKRIIKPKQGKIYNANLVEDTIYNIDEKMGEKGYAFVDIEPVVNKNRETGIIDINFVIKESPKIYIGNIDIIGNTRTLDEVIRRELKIKEGDPYNTVKIRRSKQRIQNLGFFSSVDFETRRSQEYYDKVDIVIRVSEQKTGELNFAVGYSTVDKLNFSAGIKEKNVLGTGREVSLDARKSTYTTDIDFSYKKPYFLDLELYAGYDIFYTKYENRDSVGYDQRSKGFSVNGTYELTEYLTHKLSYTLVKKEISNMSEDYTGLVEEGKNSEYIGGQVFFYDKRDNKYEPTEGYYLRLAQDYAGFGGDTKYFKNVFGSAIYFPVVTRSFILKFGVEGGIIDGIGQPISPSEAFYLGGNSLRGFEYAGVGPRIQESNGSAVGGVAVGGKEYYTGEAELKFPLGLPKEYKINGSVFANAGSLSEVDYSQNLQGEQIADSNSIRSAYGAGISWFSPMGPIRLDFTKAIDKEDYDEEERFRFSFGSSF